MRLFLSSDHELLPVVDAVELIARHVVDRDTQTVLTENVPDPHARPAANIALVIQERLWAGRVGEAAVSGMLHLFDADGFRIPFDHNTFALACVKPAGLAQWLVDAYKKDVMLDGVRLESTPPVERETLKREFLVERLVSIWPTIAADLKEGSRNGLMAAAGLAHGIYDVQRALAWGATHDRLRGAPTPTPLDDLPRKVHRF